MGRFIYESVRGVLKVMSGNFCRGTEKMEKDRKYCRLYINYELDTLIIIYS